MKHQLIGIVFALLFGATAFAQSRSGIRERAPEPRPQVATRIVNGPALDRSAPRASSPATRPLDHIHDRGRPDLSRHDHGRRTITPVLHRGSSGYWRHVRERVWVPGSCRWVTYPARYEWRYDSCGRRYRVLCEPERRVLVEDPGYWDWQVRRVWVPGC